MKGILFKPDMIKAIVELRKTVTRRLDKFANNLDKSYDRTWVIFNKKYNWWEIKGRSRFTSNLETFILKPRYRVGETVYIGYSANSEERVNGHTK